jgi:uncharacterized protein DUF2800
MSNSKYADEGTVAHALAAMCLSEGKPASAYVGRLIRCDDYEHAQLSPSGAPRWMRCPGSHALETRIKFVPRTFSLQVTDDMAAGVQVYLDNLKKYMRGIEFTAQDGAVQLMVEQKLPIGHITGEEGATGSGDAVILDLAAFELQVHDLKFGRGVEVDADENEQLALYLLGALEVFGEFCDFQNFRGVIHQPRITTAPKEYVWSKGELLAFSKAAKAKAEEARNIKANAQGDPQLHAEVWAEAGILVPGDKQCRFCDAKATCPAIAKKVQEEFGATFEDLDAKVPPATGRYDDLDVLAKKYRALELIEGWCKAVAAAFESRMLAGEKHPDWKLVQGKKGNRAWSSTDIAEQTLKSMRLKHYQMYEYSLISPTAAEKLAEQVDKDGKPKPGQEDKPIGARQWKKLLPLITQAPGKPTVVPVSDKRAAIEVKPTAEAFADLTNEVPAEELV